MKVKEEEVKNVLDFRFEGTIDYPYELSCYDVGDNIATFILSEELVDENEEEYDVTYELMIVTGKQDNS